MHFLFDDYNLNFTYNCVFDDYNLNFTYNCVFDDCIFSLVFVDGFDLSNLRSDWKLLVNNQLQRNRVLKKVFLLIYSWNSKLEKKVYSNIKLFLLPLIRLILTLDWSSPFVDWIPGRGRRCRWRRRWGVSTSAEEGCPGPTRQGSGCSWTGSRDRASPGIQSYIIVKMFTNCLSFYLQVSWLLS